MPSVNFIIPDMNSYYDSSDDSIRRVTDDFGRHRLTDVQEEESEEDGFGSHLYKYSTRKRYSSIGSAASSMDTLWDLHPGRLSEAGLSRHSDSSAVLTEDTDSFIIGQRVWVSGNKPGHIAFIGETQFAPGEWAGIALDEAIGKNDGSVGGTRYFQCEPKKGVFARLTRLTRFPLAQEGMGSGDTYTTTPSPVNNGVRRSPVSPTGSTKGSLRYGGIGDSNTSLASAASHVIDYRLGDRVIIKSSQGSKVGTVRYIGLTEFAVGEWVGVELDDPRGKNDGSVNGRRYFECRPNFGLFAPVSKVSKSPSKIKPNACQIHSGPGLPPSGIKKATSKESLSSNMSLTSAASSVRRVRLGVNSLTPKKTTPTKSTSTPIPTRTALQDLLKEKQQHIEQLLKERDLERAEIIRAASQAEEAEQKLAVVRQEYEKYKAECTIMLQEHINMLNKLKEDRNELVVQLDEEKRKNEDVQFRLAEASISQEDIEVTNENFSKKITELEGQLAKERQKVDNLEADANKLFEAEESLIKAKDLIQSLRKQLKDTQDKELALEGDTASTTVLIASLQKELDQYKQDLEERDTMISILKQEITKVASESKKQAEEAMSQKTEFENVCHTKDTAQSKLRDELEQINKLLQDKVAELEKISSDKLGSEMALEKEVNRLKMELGARVHDLENMSETSKAKETNIETLQAEVQSLKEQLGLKVSEGEYLNKEFAAQLAERDKLIEEMKADSINKQEEIKRLSEEIVVIKQQSETSIGELKLALDKTLNEKADLQSNLEQTIKEVTQNQEKSNNALKQLEQKNSEFDMMKTQLENLQLESSETTNKLNEELENLKDSLANKGSIIQSLQLELQTTKIDLDSTSKNLLQYQNNLSDVESSLKKERDEIKESLKTKVIELEETKKDFSSKITQRDCELQELSAALKQKSEEAENLTKGADSLRDSHDKAIKALSNQHSKDLLEKNSKITEIFNDLENKTKEVNEMVTKVNKSEEKLKHQFTETETLRDDLANRVKECQSSSEIISGLTNDLEQLKKTNAQLQTNICNLEGLQANLENEIKNKENEFNSKSSELQVSSQNLQQQDKQIQDLQKELSVTRESLNKVSEDLKIYQDNSKGTEIELQKEKEKIQVSLEAKNTELDEVKNCLNKKLLEAESKLSESDELITSKIKEIGELNTEIIQLNSKHETLIKEICDRHKSEFGEVEIRISDLLTEVENKDLEIDAWSRNVTDLEKVLSEKDDTIKKLHEDLKTTQKQNLSNQESTSKLCDDINNLTLAKEEVTKRLQESEERRNNISVEREKLEKEMEMLSSKSLDFGNTLNIKEAEIQEREKLLQKVKTEYENKLHILEKQITDLEQNNKTMESDIQKQKSEYDDILASVYESESMLKATIASNKDEEIIKELQDKLKNTTIHLEEKDKSLGERNNEIAKLKEELKKAQSQQNISNGSVNPKNTNPANEINQNTDYQQLLEEKVFAESQVAFLNSIIVDMQKKNEEQKARIEILEMGYNAAAADELATLGFKVNKQPAPRMYCDICEEFDLHETEDCPTQGEDEPPVSNRAFGKEPKEKPPPRPYCEICGEFGHATEDCTGDQEF